MGREKTAQKKKRRQSAEGLTFAKEDTKNYATSIHQET